MNRKKLGSLLRKFQGKIVQSVQSEVKGPKDQVEGVEVDRAVVERCLKVTGPAVFGIRMGSEVRRRRKK